MGNSMAQFTFGEDLLNHCKICDMDIFKCAYEHCDKCNKCVLKKLYHCNLCNSCHDNNYKLCPECKQCVDNYNRHSKKQCIDNTIKSQYEIVN